jgi:hypothetical protein
MNIDDKQLAKTIRFEIKQTNDKHLIKLLDFTDKQLVRLAELKILNLF